MRWLTDTKAQHGILQDDFESVTFATREGVNVHLSCSDRKIRSGRDLVRTMDLRKANKDGVDVQIQGFYQDKDAIVSGCAGLKGMLASELVTELVGLFMFGEVCCLYGKADFGNLMLSKSKIIEK